MTFPVKITRVPDDVSREDLRQFFRHLNARIPPGGLVIIGGSEQVAFVAFDSPEARVEALAFSGRSIKGRQIYIESITIHLMKAAVQVATCGDNGRYQTSDRGAGSTTARRSTSSDESFGADARPPARKRHRSEVRPAGSRRRRSRSTSASRNQRGRRSDDGQRTRSSRRSRTSSRDRKRRHHVDRSSSRETLARAAPMLRSSKVYSLPRRSLLETPPSAMRSATPHFGSVRGRQPWAERGRGGGHAREFTSSTPKKSVLLTNLPSHMQGHGDIAKFIYDNFKPTGKCEVVQLAKAVPVLNRYWGKCFRVDFDNEQDWQQALILNSVDGILVTRWNAADAPRGQPRTTAPFSRSSHWHAGRGGGGGGGGGGVARGAYANTDSDSFGSHHSDRNPRFDLRELLADQKVQGRDAERIVKQPPRHDGDGSRPVYYPPRNDGNYKFQGPSPWAYASPFFRGHARHDGKSRGDYGRAHYQNGGSHSHAQNSSYAKYNWPPDEYKPGGGGTAVEDAAPAAKLVNEAAPTAGGDELAGFGSRECVVCLDNVHPSVTAPEMQQAFRRAVDSDVDLQGTTIKRRRDSKAVVLAKFKSAAVAKRIADKVNGAIIFNRQIRASLLDDAAAV